MSANPFVGEIMLVAGNYAPAGWMLCDGQLLSIAQNETLFFVIGTTYGGDGRNTFALPDLRGSLAVHTGQGPGLTARILGEKEGAESSTLGTPNLPAHTHAANARAGNGTSASPASLLPARDAAGALHHGGGGGDATLAPEAIAPLGGGQPHGNMQPTLALHFCISLYGVFPSPS
ncbi:MAG: tail fiber protein [Candidatus Eisenbacteria bacterium]